MFTTLFWKDTAERAIATFAQTLVMLAGVGMTDWLSLDWLQMVIMSLIAAGLSVLKGLAAANIGNEVVPSVVNYTYDAAPIAGSPVSEDHAE